MKLAMAREGKGFFGDGIDLSWPQNGARKVIEVSDDQSTWPFRLRERFMNGTVVAMPDDAPVTQERFAPDLNRLMPGGSPEAVAHFAIPAPETIRARAITTEELVGLATPSDVDGEPAEDAADDEPQEPEEAAEVEDEPEEAEAETEPAPKPRRTRRG